MAAYFYNVPLDHIVKANGSRVWDGYIDGWELRYVRRGDGSFAERLFVFVRCVGDTLYAPPEVVGPLEWHHKARPERGLKVRLMLARADRVTFETHEEEVKDWEDAFWLCKRPPQLVIEGLWDVLLLDAVEQCDVPILVEG